MAQTDQKRVFTITENTESVTGKKPPTKYWETLVHFIKAYVGTGIFAMGDAFNNSGILFGPALLTIFGLVNLFCQHKLVTRAKHIAEKEPIEVRPTFAETVEYTLVDSSEKLQKHAKLVVAAANGYEFNIHYMFLIMFLPMWLVIVCLSNLKVLVPLSIIANTLLWAGICIIYYYTSQDLPPISERPLVTQHFERIPLAIGTALFAFEGITFVLPLRNEMGTPRRFTTLFGVLNVGFISVLSLYISVGVMSYYKYGETIQGSVFLNFPQKELLAMCVKALMAIATACTYTLHYYVAIEVTYPNFYNKYGPFKHPNLMFYTYKTVPVFITFLVANLIPFLELFISLIGCVSGTVLALIMPPLLELLASDAQTKLSTVIFDIIIIVIGLLGMILGFVISVYFIVLAFMKNY